MTDHRKILNRINTASLLVYNHLISEYRLWEEKSGTSKNIVGVFFHDLMRIMTSYIYRFEELKNSVYLPELRRIKCKNFPYIDYLDVEDSLKVKEKSFTKFSQNPLAHSRKVTFLSSMSKRVNPNGLRIGLTSCGINLRTFIPRLIFKGYRIEFPQVQHIYIPFADQQIESLIQMVQKILLDLTCGKAVDPVTKIIEKHIHGYLINREESLDQDLLVIGSPCNLQNRFLAAQASSQSLPVFGMNHGHASGLLNEPVFGYGDSAYLSHLLGFGSFKKLEEGEPPYMNAITHPTEYVPCDSSLISKIYKPYNKIRSLSKFKKPVFMYVPTLFSGFDTYGPFRSIPDELYRRWQRNIIQCFPNLLVKVHPKGQEFELGIKAKILKKRFEKVVNHTDVFIFDYVSTAFTIAVATDKPIIFFDLGIRNLTFECELAIKKRCIYITIKDLDDPTLYDKVLEFKSRKLVNTYTEAFSLYDGKSLLENTLLKSIERVLEKGKINNRQNKNLEYSHNFEY